MKDFILFLSIFSCLSLFYSCTGDGHGKLPGQIDVDVEVEGDPSDFFDGYSYSMFETNDSCLIEKIIRYDIENDLIAIQNKQEIFLFDAKGKFKSGFCRQGQGPEEYLAIDALRLYNGYVYVLDQDGKAIIAYTAEGEFARKIGLDAQYVDFYVFDDEEIVLASGNFNHTMYQFARIDSKTGDVKCRMGEYGKSNTVVLRDYVPFAGKHEGKLVVNVPFILTSYLLDNNQIEPMSCFKFNTLEQMPELTLENVNINEMSDITQNKSMVRELGYYMENEKSSYESFNLFLFDKGGIGSHIAKYDENGFVSQIRLNSSDFEEYPYLSGRKMKFYEGQMIDIVEPYSLLYRDEKKGNDFWTKKGITYDSNPVIFFYHMK